MTQIRHAKNNNYNDFHTLHESHIVDPNEFITSRRERYDENEDNENFSGGKLKIRSKNDHSYEWRQRLAIAHIYESMFSLENRDKWSKRHGTIYKIRKVLGLNRGAHTLIKNVLENFTKCLENGMEYDGKRTYSAWNDSKHLLPCNSYECKIIADTMDDGHGLRAATQLVNEYR